MQIVQCMADFHFIANQSHKHICITQTHLHHANTFALHEQSCIRQTHLHNTNTLASHKPIFHGTGACAAQQLCGMSGMPIPIKLPADKNDPSPSAPDEAKHICAHCRYAMHGGVCGYSLSYIDMTTLHKHQT